MVSLLAVHWSALLSPREKALEPTTSGTALTAILSASVTTPEPLVRLTTYRPDLPVVISWWASAGKIRVVFSPSTYTVASLYILFLS